MLDQHRRAESQIIVLCCWTQQENIFHLVLDNEPFEIAGISLAHTWGATLEYEETDNFVGLAIPIDFEKLTNA